MVNKPLSEKTIVDNVLKHGVGAINVDACRIPFSSKNELWKGHQSTPKFAQATECKREGFGYNNPKREHDFELSANPQGRFPANLLVSDGALDTGKITVSKWAKSKAKRNKSGSMFFKDKSPPEERDKCDRLVGEYGDQSRFFDLDAWAKHHGFLDVPKASKQERDKGLEAWEEKDWVMWQTCNGTSGKPSSLSEGRKTKRKNVHPTVKPIKLMAYLVELGCPSDGVVLDPFCGTGSTLIASHKLDRKWIGIDIKGKYVKISRYRLASLDHKLGEFLNAP